MEDRQRQDIKRIIQGDQAQLLVEFAERAGKRLADNGLTTSQIRNFFGQVRQIEAVWRIADQRAEAERAFTLLKPRLAYQKAKERNNAGVGELSDILTTAIDAAIERVDRGSPEVTTRFQRFVDLFEAILAYHKAAGGRD